MVDELTSRKQSLRIRPAEVPLVTTWEAGAAAAEVMEAVDLSNPVGVSAEGMEAQWEAVIIWAVATSQQ